MIIDSKCKLEELSICLNHRLALCFSFILISANDRTVNEGSSFGGHCKLAQRKHSKYLRFGPKSKTNMYLATAWQDEIRVL